MEYTATLSLAEGRRKAEVKKKLEGQEGVYDLYAEDAQDSTIVLLTYKQGMQNPLDKAGIPNSCVSLKIFERPPEDLIALWSTKETDYAGILARIYADPYSTPTLTTNPRIFHGFIFEDASQRLYRTPEDLHKLLAAIRQGTKITNVYRKTGEHAAACGQRILLARANEYYPTTEEILKPFKPTKTKTNAINTLSILLKEGRITIDNTFKPKTVTVKKEDE